MLPTFCEWTHGWSLAFIEVHWGIDVEQCFGWMDGPHDSIFKPLLRLRGVDVGWRGVLAIEVQAAGMD